MSGAGQYSWLKAFTGQEVTMEVAPCNWNSKNYYAGCVLAVVLEDGTKMYPNMIGIDPSMGTQLQNPVISEVVLTRGWSGSDNKQSAVRTAGQSVKAQGALPMGVYKKMTKLEAGTVEASHEKHIPVVQVEGNIVTRIK